MALRRVCRVSCGYCKWPTASSSYWKLLNEGGTFCFCWGGFLICCNGWHMYTPSAGPLSMVHTGMQQHTPEGTTVGDVVWTARTHTCINAYTWRRAHINVHKYEERYAHKHIDRETYCATSILSIQAQFTTCMSYLFPQHCCRLFVSLISLFIFLGPNLSGQLQLEQLARGKSK